MEVVRQCGCSGSWSIPHMLLLKVMVWYIVSETCKVTVAFILDISFGFWWIRYNRYLHSVLFFLQFSLGFISTFFLLNDMLLDLQPLYLYCTHDSISILKTASMEKFSILVKICVDHQPNQGPLEMLISCCKYWKSLETHFVCRF